MEDSKEKRELECLEEPSIYPRAPGIDLRSFASL